MKYLDQVFDTRVDTKKMFVPINTHFTPRGYKNRFGKSLLYLDVTGEGERQRIPLDIYIQVESFSPKTQRVSKTDPEHRSINLILDNIESKITAIYTTYYLTNKRLSVSLFKEEFLKGIPRVDFISFCRYHLKNKEGVLASGTHRRYDSYINKVEKFKARINFSEIDHKFLLKFESWLTKKNKSSTVASNMATTKMFLNAAKKQSILFPLDPDDIRVGSTMGDRTDLLPEEVRKLNRYFFSEFIPKKQKLILGYFLFSCFNGLRISEIILLTRDSFKGNFFEFCEPKNNRLLRRKINNSTRALLEEHPELFSTFFTPEYMNRILKEIITHCEIKKNVSFHVGRHTFATNYIRLGGDVVSLSKLIKHSSINQTMIYVHTVESETNEKSMLIDQLL